MNTNKKVSIILICVTLLAIGLRGMAQDQGSRLAGTHQDNTRGKDWISRLERPDRIPGLKIDEVIKCLGLKSGDVIADIGSGTGAYTIPFAKAVAPTGKALGVDIHQDLLDYIAGKAKKEKVRNLQTVLAELDDPNLPKGEVDVAFFHDVFHNVNDRLAYLQVLSSYLKPSGRIVIIEQEYNDPIAIKWDIPEDRITKGQVDSWMSQIGYHLVDEFDTFQGTNNPKGAGMPERWFVVYGKGDGIMAETKTTLKGKNLFNGKDLTGWHIDVPAMDNDASVPIPFIIRNGVLVSLGEPRGHLITDEVFKNYRLEVEYRFSANPGNCGVLVHSSAPRVLYKMFPQSIEVQMQHENAGDFFCILEDIKTPDMEVRRGPKEKWGTGEGKNRQIKNLTDGSEKPAGDWNYMIIECVGREIKVWVNGVVVNHGFECTAEGGQIALQAEGSEVEFRKVILSQINELSKEPLTKMPATALDISPLFIGELIDDLKLTNSIGLETGNAGQKYFILHK